MSAPTASCTDLTKSHALLLQVLQGWLVAATERRPSTNFASISVAQFVGVVGSVAERLGRKCDRGHVGLDANVELRADVDAHAVLGDQRVRSRRALTSRRRVLRLTAATEWKIGSTSEPPSSTTFWPPRPVRT